MSGLFLLIPCKTLRCLLTKTNWKMQPYIGYLYKNVMDCHLAGQFVRFIN